MANLPFDEYQEEINGMEALIVDALGEKQALEAISKALDYDTKKEIYEYIIRCYDLAPDERG